MRDEIRLGEAVKQLSIFVEGNGKEQYSDELAEIRDRLTEIMASRHG